MDIKLQLYNDQSREKTALYLRDQLHRERGKRHEAGVKLNQERRKLAVNMTLDPASEAVKSELQRRVDAGKIIHQAIAASAPLLDSSAFLPIEIQTVWNRLFRVGIEIRDGVYLPSLSVDDEVAAKLKGYLPVPYEKVRPSFEKFREKITS